MTDSDIHHPRRRIFCNRTLNLKAIRAIGYDMDYTLIHYHVDAWEQRAFEYLREKLLEMNWPVADATFDRELVIRGLIIDKELGNIVKANRFGYIKQAVHGRRALPFDALRHQYARSIVDLTESRWVFLNTLFSLSEANMFLYLVDQLDAGKVPSPHGYDAIYGAVKTALDEAHMEGRMKAEIIANPDRFVDLDPGTAQALLDQRDAGKTLLLITNSEWPFSSAMMHYAFDRYLPAGMTWEDLFDLVIVSARKAAFFEQPMPLFKVINDQGYLAPCPSGFEAGHRRYLGGSAVDVERYLGVSGSDVLYVGDHLYSDVHASKSIRRWRTALVLREIEEEVDAIASFTEQQTTLHEAMREKSAVETQLSQLKLLKLHAEKGRLDAGEAIGDVETLAGELKARQTALDQQITPLAIASSKLYSARWGLLLRTGNDKSHLARHLERHADIYTSRVSNFAAATPFAYFRSPRGTMAHDPLPDL